MQTYPVKLLPLCTYEINFKVKALLKKFNFELTDFPVGLSFIEVIAWTESVGAHFSLDRSIETRTTSVCDIAKSFTDCQHVRTFARIEVLKPVPRAYETCKRTAC